jgi:hypothetical protein
MSKLQWLRIFFALFTVVAGYGLVYPENAYYRGGRTRMPRRTARIVSGILLTWGLLLLCLTWLQPN